MFNITEYVPKLDLTIQKKRVVAFFASARRYILSDLGSYKMSTVGGRRDA